MAKATLYTLRQYEKLPSLPAVAVVSLVGMTAALMNNYKPVRSATIFEDPHHDFYTILLKDYKEKLLHRFEIVLSKDGTKTETVRVSLKG